MCVIVIVTEHEETTEVLFDDSGYSRGFLSVG